MPQPQEPELRKRTVAMPGGRTLVFYDFPEPAPASAPAPAPRKDATPGAAGKREES
jgi:hypothetical protein